MGAEAIKLFGKIEVDIAASATGTFSILTDVPGYALAQRFSFTVPVTTRRPVAARIPFNTAGHLLQATYSSGGQSVLYGARIWARELPGGPWRWYVLPVIETPAEYHPMDLPIPRTPEEWRSSGLPIPETSEEWRSTALPIPETPEAWGAMKLPVKETPVVPEWSDLEIDR